MRVIFYLVIILFIGTIHAAETIGSFCKPIAVKGEVVSLSAKKPRLVMIHSLSQGDLWITHPVADASASAGWSSQLQAGNWSALALDESSFELNCIEVKPGHEQQVPCAGVISLCYWSPPKMPKAASGTYWAGENMILSALREHLGGRGFQLPASSQ